MKQEAIDRKAFAPQRQLPSVDEVRDKVRSDQAHAAAALWLAGLTDELGNWINTERKLS